MATKKAKGDINPTEVLAVRWFKKDLDSKASMAFMVYRDADTPKAEQVDIGHIKPDPVMFQVVDANSKVLERDMAETFGKAMDYASQLAIRQKLILTDKP